MSAFARCLGLTFEKPMMKIQDPSEKSSLHKKWRNFDDNCMKPIFGG